MKQLRKMTLLFPLVLMLTACPKGDDTSGQLDLTQDYQTRKLLLPDGQVVEAYVAETERQQEQGLSGVKKLKANQGMVFLYPKMMALRFWMPDTYLNLDIFFMDSDLLVLHIERNIPAHPGRQEPPPIARTSTVYAQIVLELESGSPAARAILKGHRLKWLNHQKTK